MEKNITAALVRKHVLSNPILIDYLSRNIMNVASLARELLPFIQKENKKATVESISVALQRLQFDKKQKITAQLKKVLNNVQITMRTDVSLFCLAKGGGVDIRKFGSDDIFYINQGSDEVTVIVDKKNKHLITGTPLLHKENLALISLKDSLINTDENYRITPGFIHMFLSNISKEGINVEDIISTYSQVTFVVEEKFLSSVFKICKEVKDLKIL
ncbi:MAG: hypothetical protein AABX82_03320 [Nanoarchaeota archaeon]